MRLQHSVGQGLYRDLLQAAMIRAILFGFRKIEDSVAQTFNL